MLNSFIYRFLTRSARLLSPILQYLPGKTGKFFQMQLKWEKYIQNLPIQPGGIWVHAASVGEYEQAKPVIRMLKKKFPEKPVILSFFSPSGYRFLTTRTPADFVVPMPLDTRKNAQKFIDYTGINAALFVKYEIWPHFLQALSGKKIPVFIISAIFRENQTLFKNRFLKSALEKCSGFFVQDEKSANLLKKYQLNPVYLTGDTRFDTVRELLEHKTDFPLVNDFKRQSKLLIAGSTWPKDEDILLEWLEKYAGTDWKLFLIPHEPSEKHIRRLLNKIKSPVARYSEYGPDGKNARILIGDTLGLLKYVYKYADVTYIGGGFGKGIHNILEAAVYGKPVIFGPNYHKFKEAKDLLALGGAFEIRQAADIARVTRQIYRQDENLNKIKQINQKYIEQNSGATKKMMDILEKFIN